MPAESARIGLTDKLLTRVATRETVSKVNSAVRDDWIVMLISADAKHLYDRSPAGGLGNEAGDKKKPNHH